MNVQGSKIKIFSGNANRELAKAIAENVGVPLGDAEVKTFSDGEICVKINETVRGADVFIIQPTCHPVNNNLMELLIMIDACKRASAGRINAVIPYYGYARQDRKARARDPITAKLVADLITVAGADRVLTMDLHAAQIQGYFNIPTDHLLGAPILSKYIINMNIKNPIVVSPDHGSAGRARNFAEKLDCPMAIIDKRRPKENVAEVMNIIGDVKGKTAILIDDMVDTAGTLTLAAEALIENGAVEVYAAATHGVLSGPAIERIESSPIKELIITDSIPLPEHKRSPKIKVVSVAPLFAEAIVRIYEGMSVSKLFE
ncbi:ribose-phosphate pyrophosphokinase [Caldanaerobius fijiensis DSM 17918]|uniref:Ribose-phosphate pyrophosphokinase n=1 Tax=Caldanaerobius fijiensis DSM 17918 TaxID=1121256 RepID=A0A1M5ATI9_9THEO|nr:ribose-phosphate pyrophosphokinase [Caldanaerobius fijiensis]SHF33543.1 ribose-phosphate pyrophosphokinase [Caldanaerobius fijiensis DSM 17918]